MKADNQHEPKSRRYLKTICAVCLGALAGVCAHYIAYRLSLPSTPFIYVAF